MCLRIAPSLSHLRSRFGAFEVELAQVNCVSSGFIVLLPALRPIVSNRHRRQTRSTPVIFVLNIAPIEIAFPVRVQSAAVAHQAECWPCLLRGTAIAATCRTAFSLCKCVEHFARFSIQIFVQMTRINYAACEKLKRISIFLSSCALKSFCRTPRASWRACFCGRARSVGAWFLRVFEAAARQQRACLSAHARVFVAPKLN